MKILNALDTFYVYRHIRPDKNEVFYIGIGSHQKKWKHNRAHTLKSRNIHWQRIVEKNNGHFIVEILFDNISKDFACTKEKEFINLYGRSDLKKGTLCNLRDGGEGGFNLSEESKKKIGDSNRGENSSMFGKSHSESWKLLMKTKMSGEGNPNYGKVLPEYQKVINRQAQSGRKHSSETIEKRVSQLRKKVIDLDNNIIYNSIGEVAKVYNYSNCQMTRLINKNKFNLKFL